MILCLSVQRVINAISALEGVTVDPLEFEERGLHFAGRLRVHLINHGLVLGEFRDRGELVDYRATVTTSDRDMINRGLEIIQPLSVTVDVGDLENLVPNKMTAIVMRDNFASIAPMLNKIAAVELWDKLEAAARSLIFAPQSEAQDVEANLTFEQWCLRNNLPIPGRRQEMRERQYQEQVRLRKEANDRRVEEREHDSDHFYIREME